MPDTVMATFRVREGSVDRLAGLLDRHFETISRLGLGGGPTPLRLLGEEEGGAVLYEIFDWQDGAIPRAAERPEVVALWREIDECCEARGGWPGLAFPHVRRMPAGSVP